MFTLGSLLKLSVLIWTVVNLLEKTSKREPVKYELFTIVVMVLLLT